MNVCNAPGNLVEQVSDLSSKRLLVLGQTDIDIKLRSCKGSCGGHTEYQVDKESYVALEKQVNAQTWIDFKKKVF